MKLIVGKNQLDSTVEIFLQRAGYRFMPGHEPSFTRALGRNNYPRFHVYTEIGEEKIVFNMHLDQKEASYQGAHMHNADYEGSVVVEEARRLQTLVKEQLPVVRLRESVVLTEPKKNWFQKLFK